MIDRVILSAESYGVFARLSEDADALQISISPQH
jgi:hypothetical protein